MILVCFILLPCDFTVHVSRVWGFGCWQLIFSCVLFWRFRLISVRLPSPVSCYPPPPHTHTHTPVSHPYLESGRPLHCSQSASTRGFFQDHAKASGESITRTVKKCQSKAHKQKHSGQSDITKGDKGAHLWFWKTKFPFSLSTCKCRNSDLHNLHPVTSFQQSKAPFIRG